MSKKQFSKWIGFITLVCACALFTSCLGNYNNPRIVFHRLYLNDKQIANTETPIPVGDTLYIEVELNGCGNELTQLQIDIDREYLKDSLITVTEQKEELCTEYSQPSKGFYQFKPETYVIGTYWMLIPIKARVDQSETFTINMRLQNESKVEDPYNPYVKEFLVLVSDSTLIQPAK